MLERIAPGPVDPFFHLKKKADQDTHPHKIDVGVGIYRSEKGTYQELEVVKKAKKILDGLNLGHDYELTVGDSQFLKLAAGVMFGQDSDLIKAGLISSVQTLSGTGANHIGILLLARSFNPRPKVYIPTPGWANAKPLVEFAGLETEEYRYINPQTRELDFESCQVAVRSAPKGSIFVLQGCCHNPTGKDLSPIQWQELGQEIKARNHLAFIDIAYQGLGRGLDEDAVGVRTLASLGIDMLVCQSFSKNFALYGERCGVLHAVAQTPTAASNVQDQLRSLIRREFSSSPAYGSRLVTIVLSDPQLRNEWVKELSDMRVRLQRNRRHLEEQLTTALETPGAWKHITDDIGLFSVLDISPEHVNSLIDDYHIHLPPSGRINVAGLSTDNLERAASAIDKVVRNA